jgi:hypothetical protein
MVVKLADEGVVGTHGLRGGRQKIAPLRTGDGCGVKLVDQAQDN